MKTGMTSFLYLTMEDRENMSILDWDTERHRTGQSMPEVAVKVMFYKNKEKYRLDTIDNRSDATVLKTPNMLESVPNNVHHK